MPLSPHARRPRNSPPRVLLANDEPELLLALKAVLVGMGYDVTTAEGYGEAHSTLRGAHFDAVVTDYRLNGQKGHGLLLAEEAKKKDPASAVILVAGDPEDVEHSAEKIRACVNEYLFKPVGVKRLLACLTRALERSAARPQVSVR